MSTDRAEFWPEQPVQEAPGRTQDYFPWFVLPPRRRKEKLAQGKGAERPPPWVTAPPPPTTPSFHGSPRQPTGGRGEPWKEENTHYIVTPDGASLVRGYSRIVPLGLRTGSLRSQMARTCG